METAQPNAENRSMAPNFLGNYEEELADYDSDDSLVEPASGGDRIPIVDIRFDTPVTTDQPKNGDSNTNPTSANPNDDNNQSNVEKCECSLCHKEVTDPVESDGVTYCRLCISNTQDKDNTISILPE